MTQLTSSLKQVRVLAVVLAVLAAGFSAAPARAQIEAVEPYWAVVVDAANDGILLRSGDGKAYYPVASLKADQVVRVRGEGKSWVQVDYPAFVTALVLDDEVEPVDGNTRVRLTTESHLKALHAEYGVRGSWKRLFEPPLRAGTTLTVVKTHTADDGRITYEVTPPEGARGYIFADSIRRATPAEIEAHLAKVAAGTTDPAKTEQDETELAQTPTPGDADEPELAQPETTEPAQSEIAQEQPAQDDARDAIVLSDPISPPEAEITIEPLTPTITEQDSAEPSPALTDARPQDSNTPVTEIDQSTAEVERPLLTPNQLFAAFDRVMKQDTLDAEYDQLIKEFGRTIAQQDDDESSRTTRISLEQRQSLLEVRKGIQQSQRKIAASRREASAQDRALAKRLEQLNQTRVYELVGRLVPSTIYDGTNLPRLYRLQSVGTPLPRTLGYIRADRFEGLDRRVGQVVGVLGKPELDQDLKLRVIAAERVDLITPNVRTTSVPTTDE